MTTVPSPAIRDASTPSVSSTSSQNSITIIIGFLIVSVAVFGGFFVAALVMCSLRSRRRNVLGDIAEGQSTPKLWEVCTDSNSVQSHQWEDILPLATEIQRNRSAPRKRKKLEKRQDGPSWKGRARHLWSPTRVPAQSTAPAHGPSQEIVQVTMIVLMPAPLAVEPQEIGQASRTRNAPYDYAIGMVRVPYDNDMDALL